MTDTLTREPQALPPFPLMTLGDVVLCSLFTVLKNLYNLFC